MKLQRRHQLKHRPGSQWLANGSNFFESCSRLVELTLRNAQVRDLQQRQRPLERRLTGVGQPQRFAETLIGRVEGTVGCVQVAEETMDGKQGKRLAGIGGIGERLLG